MKKLETGNIPHIHRDTTYTNPLRFRFKYVPDNGDGRQLQIGRYFQEYEVGGHGWPIKGTTVTGTMWEDVPTVPADAPDEEINDDDKRKEEE